jgi:hypothetical protein
MVHWLALLLLTDVAVAWVFDFSFPNDEILFIFFWLLFFPRIGLRIWNPSELVKSRYMYR